jgi:hypothetical protein
LTGLQVLSFNKAQAFEQSPRRLYAPTRSFDARACPRVEVEHGAGLGPQITGAGVVGVLRGGKKCESNTDLAAGTKSGVKRSAPGDREHSA